jgi:hypothetical protein
MNENDIEILEILNKVAETLKKNAEAPFEPEQYIIAPVSYYVVSKMSKEERIKLYESGAHFAPFVVCLNRLFNGEHEIYLLDWEGNLKKIEYDEILKK